MKTVASPARVEHPYHNPVRQLNGVLASAERRALIWIASRLPRWVTSDRLTALALAAMAGAGLSLWLARTTRLGLVFAIVCLALNWFGDSLDGTLARVRNQQRPRFGFYVDHVVDAVGTACLFGGFALSGYMSPAIAAALVLGYLLVNIEVLLATNTLGSFRMSTFGVGATELRILLALGLLRVFARRTTAVFGREFLFLDIAGAMGAVGLLGALVYAVVATTRTLARLEPLPPRPRSES